MLVLIDNYDSFTYNLYHLVTSVSGSTVSVFRNNAISVLELESLSPSAIFISPGPCTPTEAGICLDTIKHFAPKVPIFGVCLGHQAIGQAFGGKIVKISPPIHGKSSIVRHNNSAMFHGIPNEFEVIRYHSLVIERSTIPECLTPTSFTSDGIIMSVSHNTYNVHGVQFHPESIGSTYGAEIIRNFLNNI